MSMSTITTAKFWKDIGYTDGCIEVPPANDTLPTQDLSFSSLNPSKDRMFSELRVPEDYVTMLDYSYLSIAVDNNNGSDKTFYGWIDSIEMISDTTNAPITQINWHVDLWRTYFANAEFGSGMVKRRPVDSDQPPQQPSYRYKTPGTAIDLSQNDGIWWVIVAITYEDNTDVILEYRAVPVTDNYYSALYIGSTPVKTLSLRDIFTGRWDEIWNLKPESILSVYLSPIAPRAFTGTGTQSSPIDISTGWYERGTDGNAYFSSLLGGGTPSTYYSFEQYKVSFGTGVEYMTDDTTSYVIRGFNGETVGVLPWGVPVIGYDMRIAYSVTSAYIQLRFRPKGTNNTYDYTLSEQYGLVFTIPLWTIDVTENSWSSYVYSSQRQYDQDQRNLNTKSSAVSGGLSVGASALSGAATGAMLGSVVPGIGTLVGAGLGALGGALAGAISTAGNYAYETGYKNDEMQRMEDYAHADQADGLLLPGNGIDCVFYGKQLTMVPYSIDTYSATQYSNDLAQYGAKVSEPTADCSTLISAGGPLQIQNLVVLGDIPPNAKQYIKQRFSQGVVIL